MGGSFKWILLGIVFGVVSILLYTAIDSKSGQTGNTGIWMTILFFCSAVITILCGFNAVDASDEAHRKAH